MALSLRGVSARSSLRTRVQTAPLFLQTVVLLSLHAPLGLMMIQSRSFATAHAFAVVAVAFAMALGRKPERVVYAAAYIVGADVMWRMTGADVYWEAGKYALFAVFALAAVRMRGVRWPIQPVLYFLLLVPSISMMPYELLSVEAKEQLSFNLSGPLALMMSVLFLSQIQLTQRQLLQTVVAVVAPLVAVVAIAVYSTVTAEQINFTLESNVVTSGGYGPNQVSTVLGLGAMLAFMAGIVNKPEWKLRNLLFAVAILLGLQSAMTFSRGGLYGAVLSIVVPLVILLRDTRSRVMLLVTVPAAVLVLSLVVLPRMDDLTGGRLSERFKSTDPTGRTALMAEDLELWREHPLLGVGPGGRKETRGSGKLAHTEFTRTLAEHGSLGAMALMVLLFMALQAVRSTVEPRHRALVLAFLCWSLVTMMHSAMRTVAPAFVFGLAFAVLSTTKGRRSGSGSTRTSHSARAWVR